MRAKQDENIILILPGIFSLFVFAIILTKVENEFAGRSYATYGGVYIAVSLFWLSFIENEKLLISDLVGVAFCLVGATIILFSN